MIHNTKRPRIFDSSPTSKVISAFSGPFSRKLTRWKHVGNFEKPNKKLRAQWTKLQCRVFQTRARCQKQRKFLMKPKKSKIPNWIWLIKGSRRSRRCPDYVSLLIYQVIRRHDQIWQVVRQLAKRRRGHQQSSARYIWP